VKFSVKSKGFIPGTLFGMLMVMDTGYVHPIGNIPGNESLTVLSLKLVELNPLTGDVGCWDT
jgi:hypothetical protein